MGLIDRLLVPGQKKFAMLVRDGLRRAGETRAIDYERDRFRLMIAGKPLPLANFYREFCESPPEEREDVVRRAVQTWRIEPAAASPAEIAPDRLWPVLWPRSFVELAALQQEDEDSPPPWPHRIVAEHLAAGVGLQTAGGVRPLGGEALKSAEIEFAAAWDAACDNLRRKKTPGWRRTSEGYFACQSRDGAASAWLFLDEEIGELPLAGRPIAMAPHRDLLFVAGADETEALTAMAERARSVIEQSPALSGFAFELREEQWRPWLPHRDHPAFAALKLLRLESQGRDYNQQRRLFDELGRKAEQPLCLATFSAMEDPQTGEPMSFALWPEGLEILLPQVEQVLFFQPDATGERGEVLAQAPWERVLRTVGDLMQPLEVYPPRFLVSEFPDEERLRAINPAT